MAKNRKKYTRKQNDEHALKLVQIVGTALSTGLVCKYYWEVIKKTNPQIENEWNWKKQQLKEKLKKPFKRG